jgi:selenide,water dikinase
MLRGVATRDDRVLVGVAEGDDAGVVSLDRSRALVHTIDVITPIVDEPRAFGRIAAANALSDVYAMGGEPLSAVSLLGVPKEFPREAVAPILKGAERLMSEAGCALVGGHTLKDKELKLGFAVTGLVDPKRMTTVAGAKAGDVLVLTKRLGTGVLYQALKAGVRTPAEERAVIRSMTSTNRAARDAMIDLGAKVATDVTGFGLIGHALNIARHSKVDLVIDRLPALPGAAKHLAAGIFPNATEVNLAGYQDGFVAEPDASLDAVRLAADPQTSGGLLVALPSKRAAAFARAVRGFVIGRVVPKAGARPKVRLLAQIG